MYERKTPLPLECGLHLTKEVLNGKWKANLLYAISVDVKRPSELLRLLPGAAKRVLNVQLKELEKHGIIVKKIFHQLPPKVEYSLTPLGESLMPIIDAMNHWGDDNRAFLRRVITQNTEADQMLTSSCAFFNKININQQPLQDYSPNLS